MFAALNTIEPRIQNLAEIDLFNAKEDWAKQRRPVVVEQVKARLASLSQWLDGREYLEARFTAGDLLMTTVLRILRHTTLVAEMPVLEAYRQRCEARPAFQKALAAQMVTFAANAPPRT
jgi:glutathione S-transferase